MAEQVPHRRLGSRGRGLRRLASAGVRWRAGWPVLLQALALGLSIHARPVVAAERMAALDRASLWLGAAYGHPEVRAGVSAFDRSFETQPLTFSGRRSLLPRARVELVLGARHGLSFDYYELRSTRAAATSQSFRFEGTEYTADASVAGAIDADIGTAAYRLWFGSGDTVLAIGAGAAFYRLEFGISGRASVNGESVEVRAGHTTHEVAPLLTVGLRHHLSDRLRVYADASGIRRTGGRLNGHIYNAAVGVEWFAWRHAGFGVEYGSKRLSLTRERSGAETRFDLQLDKPTLFLCARY